MDTHQQKVQLVEERDTKYVLVCISLLRVTMSEYLEEEQKNGLKTFAGKKLTCAN